MTCPPPILSGSHHLSQVLEGSGGHRSRGRDDRMKDRTVILKRSLKVFISGCPLLCPAPPPSHLDFCLSLSLPHPSLRLHLFLSSPTQNSELVVFLLCVQACAQVWRLKGTGDIPQKPYALFFETGVFYWPGAHPLG